MSSTSTEDKKLSILVLRSLTQDHDFASQTLPYLKPEFFDKSFANVFKIIHNYFHTYNSCPNIDALDCELETLKIAEDDYKGAKKLLSFISELNKTKPKIDIKWLIKQTEEFCKKKLYYLASIKVFEAIDNPQEQGKALKELELAQTFSFDKNIGLDYRESFEKRFKLYTEDCVRIPFGIKELDALTNGGIPTECLFLLLGPSGHGKSLIMTSMIANNLRDGLKVACYTFEMGDYRIAERIDANLLGIPINTWKDVGQEKFISKAESMLEKVKGELYIKEYPSGSANANHIKKNLLDLKQQYDFVPNIIYVDYLNICGSVSLKSSVRADSYIYMTMVAEELRAISQELKIPIVTSAQTNRNGQDATELHLSDVGDSHGITKTADYIIGFNRIDSDETMKNKLFFKQLKNRYGSITQYEKFLIGVDYPLMRIFELTPDVQEALQVREESKKLETNGYKEQLGLKPVGSLTIDDYSSSKYDSDLFAGVKF